MTNDKLTKIVKYLVNNSEQDSLSYLRLVGESLDSLSMHVENSINALELTEDELIEIALRLGNETITGIVAGQISEAKRKQFFPEAIGASTGPGTAFTSTANTAPYAKPIGMVRRKRWRKDKY